MNSEQSFDVGGILKSVMENPETLKEAMGLAAKLSQSGLFEGVFSGKEEFGEKEDIESDKIKKDDASEEGGYTELAFKSQYKKQGQGDISKHKKLLEAICLYVSDDKKEKIGLVIKILDVLESAKKIGL